VIDAGGVTGFADRTLSAVAARAGVAEAAADAAMVIAGVLRRFNLPLDVRTDAIRIARSAVHGFILLEVHGGFGLPTIVIRHSRALSRR
jgi:hypothetical protein